MNIEEHLLNACRELDRANDQIAELKMLLSLARQHTGTLIRDIDKYRNRIEELERWIVDEVDPFDLKEHELTREKWYELDRKVHPEYYR